MTQSVVNMVGDIFQKENKAVQSQSAAKDQDVTKEWQPRNN